MNRTRVLLSSLAWAGLGLGVLAALGQPSDALGHADLLLQIEELTKDIAKNPNADLYLRRGELRREHVEYEAAYADFEQASVLAPQMAIVDLFRARLLLDWGWPLTARACLDRLLSRQPKLVDGFVFRARALVKLNQRLAAAEDYDAAVAFSAEPGPDLFIERAQVLMAEGPEHYTRALQGLDEGIQKIGPLVTLQLFAIEAELKQRNFDGALARVDKITERSPRKETWLARRAEILVQAGRPAEAKRSYEAARTALRALPATRRNVPAMLELANRIQKEIDALGGSTDGKSGNPVPPLKP